MSEATEYENGTFLTLVIKFNFTMPLIYRMLSAQSNLGIVMRLDKHLITTNNTHQLEAKSNLFSKINSNFWLFCFV